MRLQSILMLFPGDVGVGEFLETGDAACGHNTELKTISEKGHTLSFLETVVQRHGKPKERLQWVVDIHFSTFCKVDTQALTAHLWV
jgi:hypothetical protein